MKKRRKKKLSYYVPYSSVWEEKNYFTLYINGVEEGAQTNILLEKKVLI